MSKHYIKKNDHFRVLLTELLPYELPFQFTNSKFYNFAKDEENKALIKKWAGDYSFTVPLEYKIPKGLEGGRQMGVMHPITQIQFVDFYKKYDDLIIHFCSRSPFSIRAPHKIADSFYLKDDENAGDEVPEELSSPKVTTVNAENSEKIARTYFAYKDFSLLHRFFTHPIFQRLEKKFPLYKRVDVSKCFYSIYTHSIAWAATNKEFAKSQIKSNQSVFETEFDKLMRLSNYNETNGIIVGPEISRIFSEVIFQKIDLQVFDRLKTEKLKHKTDYDIKRYMDDFYIFAKDERTISFITEVISEEIYSYKLHLNESKDFSQKRPFLTDISIAKIEVKKCFKEYFSVEALDISLKSGNLKSIRLINDIKSIVKKTGAHFSQVNNFIFSEIYSTHLNIIKIIQDFSYEIDPNRFDRFIERYVSIVSFLICMNVNFRSVHRSIEILLNIKEAISEREKKDAAFKIAGPKDYFEKTVFDELNIAIDGLAKANNVAERMSILIMFKVLCGDNLLSEIRLRKAVNLCQGNGEVYFKFTTSLIYIHSKDNTLIDGYEAFKEEVIDIAEKQILDAVNKMEFAYPFLLFFDYFSCPYIELNRKWDFYQKFRKLSDLTTAKHFNRSLDVFIHDCNEADFVSMISSCKKWLCFTNWDIEENIRTEIRKKELPLPY
ncbi:MAG: antiviral reverse transcriptase Drt3b [Terasakiella sp.]|uniref:antiviral reverse transcriptase Drt3b n=1 Tax=unclassified Terasakiella TaxID=2614952 RepID=UPI003AFF64FF